MNARTVPVALPVALDRALTYAVPEAWREAPVPGSRVLAPLGSRVLVGVVLPEDQVSALEGEWKLKELLDDLDGGTPSLDASLLRLCAWISAYYVAPIGEVMRLALPGLLTHADARTVRVTEAGAAAVHGAGPLLGTAEIDERQRRVLERIVEAGPAGVSVAALARVRPPLRGVFARLAELEAAGLVATDWDDGETASRTELHARRTALLHGSAADEAALQRVIGRSKQRRALLDELEARLGVDEGWTSVAELRASFPRVSQLLPPLVEAGLVVTREQPRALDPFALASVAPSSPQPPTADQREALAQLGACLERGEFASALLHGITGSGKTEVYLQLIATARAQGRGAIVLVPEIALTPQLADRFRSRFGEAVAVLHSGLTPRQRLDAWQQIRTGQRPIVIGARSAVFAPVPDLAVIVVDEEHDPSFKQEEGVRYNARDVALMRGRDARAIVVLGSATPSLETFDLARRGRHVWIRMRTRPTPRPLPKVEIVPLSVHRPDPTSLLTGVLRHAIVETVAAGEQAIVFLNRRGFTTSLVCEDCGASLQCPDCSAPSMTYHLARNRLMCHWCGHLEAPPERCPSCSGANLTHAGTGTERVEVAIERELEGVRVLRLDRDASRGRALLETLARFRRHEADVLVGTQMLSKGHDFPGVTLVGILQGDHGLALPDPRAAERTFQLLTQVAGRAGRGDRPGRVLVQAYAVGHPAIRFAAEHDYDGFAAEELGKRELLGNPPAGHLALVRIHGPDPSAVEARAHAIAAFLQPGISRVTEQGDPEQPPVRLLGPVESPIARVNRRTRWQLLLRARERAPLRWLLARLRSQLGPQGHGIRETQALVDVDPQSLL